MEGEGFEPSKAEPSDLQSDPFDRSGTPPTRNGKFNSFNSTSPNATREPDRQYSKVFSVSKLFVFFLYITQHLLMTSPMNHLYRHAVIQLAAIFSATCLIWPFRAFDEAEAFDWLYLPLTASLFAAIFARFARQPWWWQLIHFVFPLAIYAALSAAIDPGWYLLFLALTALFSPGAFTDQVPLFRSNQATLEALVSLLPPIPPKNFYDLGAGIGDVPHFLAPKFLDTNFICVETAPLSYLLGRLRTRHLPNVSWRFNSLWNTKLTDADLVYCFLSPAPMPDLWTKATHEMQEGTLLISNSFPIPDAIPMTVLDAPAHSASRPLYCYRLGKQGE